MCVTIHSATIIANISSFWPRQINLKYFTFDMKKYICSIFVKKCLSLLITLEKLFHCLLYQLLNGHSKPTQQNKLSTQITRELFVKITKLLRSSDMRGKRLKIVLSIKWLVKIVIIIWAVENWKFWMFMLSVGVEFTVDQSITKKLFGFYWNGRQSHVCRFQIVNLWVNLGAFFKTVGWTVRHKHFAICCD